MGFERLNIRVFDEIGNNAAVSSDDGSKIFEKIEKAIKNNIAINLNFMNIEFLTTAFLNAAIGQLYSTFSGDVLNEKLAITHISEEDKTTFLKVIKRAKEYFANKDEFTTTIDTVLNNE